MNFVRSFILFVTLLFSFNVAYANNFVGREGELNKLQGISKKTNFITITGTSGIGKTRLCF